MATISINHVGNNLDNGVTNIDSDDGNNLDDASKEYTNLHIKSSMLDKLCQATAANSEIQSFCPVCSPGIELAAEKPTEFLVNIPLPPLTNVANNNVCQRFFTPGGWNFCLAIKLLTENDIFAVLDSIIEI